MSSKELSIYAFSGNSDNEKQALIAGADKFFLKPDDLNELMTNLAEIPPDSAVYLVDDDPIITQLLKDCLELSDFKDNLHIFHNTLEVIIHSHSQDKVDTVVTDINMPPGPSGLVLIEALVYIYNYKKKDDQ